MTVCETMGINIPSKWNGTISVIMIELMIHANHKKTQLTESSIAAETANLNNLFIFTKERRSHDKKKCVPLDILQFQAV